MRRSAFRRLRPLSPAGHLLARELHDDEREQPSVRSGAGREPCCRAAPRHTSSGPPMGTIIVQIDPLNQYFKNCIIATFPYRGRARMGRGFVSLVRGRGASPLASPTTLTSSSSGQNLTLGPRAEWTESDVRSRSAVPLFRPPNEGSHWSAADENLLVVPHSAHWPQAPKVSRRGRLDQPAQVKLPIAKQGGLLLRCWLVIVGWGRISTKARPLCAARAWGRSGQDAPTSVGYPAWFRKDADHAPRRGGQRSSRGGPGIRKSVCQDGECLLCC